MQVDEPKTLIHEEAIEIYACRQVLNLGGEYNEPWIPINTYYSHFYNDKPLELFYLQDGSVMVSIGNRPCTSRPVIQPSRRLPPSSASLKSLNYIKHTINTGIP